MLRNSICRNKQYKFVFKIKCFDIFFALINNCASIKIIIFV